MDNDSTSPTKNEIKNLTCLTKADEYCMFDLRHTRVTVIVTQRCFSRFFVNFFIMAISQNTF